jgi:hypothetical protein
MRHRRSDLTPLFNRPSAGPGVKSIPVELSQRAYLRDGWSPCITESCKSLIDGLFVPRHTGRVPSSMKETLASSHGGHLGSERSAALHQKWVVVTSHLFGGGIPWCRAARRLNQMGGRRLRP